MVRLEGSSSPRREVKDVVLDTWTIFALFLAASVEVESAFISWKVSFQVEPESSSVLFDNWSCEASFLPSTTAFMLLGHELSVLHVSRGSPSRSWRSRFCCSRWSFKISGKCSFLQSYGRKDGITVSPDSWVDVLSLEMSLVEKNLWGRNPPMLFPRPARNLPSGRRRRCSSSRTWWRAAACKTRSSGMTASDKLDRCLLLEIMVLKACR